jgi:uncharacterized protein (DUF58 family)
MLQPNALFDNLELLAKQTVEGYIIGLHKSPFHGFSVEFAEHRLYNRGDALRHIDWKVYGRTDKLFVKRYEEETNLRCCIAIDTSSSMHFASKEGSLSKLDYSIFSAACLIQLLKKQLDATCLSFFDDTIHYLSECRSSHSHYNLLITQLEQQLKKHTIGKNTNAAQALHEIAEKMHKRSLIVIFSDMVDATNEMERLFAALQHLKYNHHEVILFHLIEAEKEKNLAFENRPYEFVDMENGEKIKLQPQQIKEAYTIGMNQFLQEITNRCYQYHIDYVPIDLSQPVQQVLHSYLIKRNKLL